MAEYEGEHSQFKADRRAAKRGKTKDKMDQGKRVKEIARMIQARAEAAKKRQEDK